jgi:hypothetical protein
MAIKMEEKGNKIYIHVKDEDNEIEPAEWSVVVDKAEFEWCVKKKQEAGYADPTGSAMLDYALTDQCFIPKRESPRDRALRLFDMILEEVQGSSDEVQVLEALKDVIDDYLFKYAGGEEE